MANHFDIFDGINPLFQIADELRRSVELARAPRTTTANGESLATLQPLTHVQETAEEFRLLADMPGVSKEDLRIHLENRELSIEATSADSAIGQRVASEGGRVLFSRSFRLPQGVAEEKVSAELKNGVLTVRIPKAEAAKPRSIQVSVN